MSTCIFLSIYPRQGENIGEAEKTKLDALLRAIPKLDKALIHTATAFDDTIFKDGKPPELVLQLYFATLLDLEAVLADGGHLNVLTSRSEFPTITDAEVNQQAMMVRPFPLPEPQTVLDNPYCTFLVSYEGEAEDLNAWLGHYLATHSTYLAKLPGIRELEVYTRLDWVSARAYPRVNFMQRNKVAFDSPEALTAALRSQIRNELRDDYQKFPPFTGPVNHFAMATRMVRSDTISPA
jgi:hypothetical protein